MIKRHRDLSSSVLALASLVSAIGSPFVAAQDSYPRPDWSPQPSPLAGDFTEPGGIFRLYGGQFPKSFNYVLDNNVVSSAIFSSMFETLLGSDPITLEEVPGLAERWEVSEDKKSFTFHINPRATWSDGAPVTADDVVYTLEAINNPDHITGALKMYLKHIEKVEKIDEKTVRFTTALVHWKNLIACGTFPILPKHWWAEQESFNDINFELPVVSGPYKLGEVKEPSSLRLVKRHDYWNADSPINEGLGNFDTIEYRFYPTREVAYEAFKKGEFDQFPVYTSSRWMRETSGERFDKNWIIKQRVHNYLPVGFQGFAMNLRKAPFDDSRVRLALAHLLDRERMNKTLMFSQYDLTGSYFPDIWSPETPRPHDLVDFDPEKAKALLDDAGWKANPATGKLEKDGTPLQIKFLSRSPSSNKFLLIFQEALESVGIDLEIEQRDWSSWIKRMDNFDFDMTWASWGGSTRKDPETMWHSDSIDVSGSVNITGFASEEVDALIEATRTEFDITARNQAIRKIDEYLVAATPYILLWHSSNTRLLYWNRFGTPEHVLGKYGREDSATSYWWNDELQAEDLEIAREEKSALPAPPSDVYFDEVFRASPTGTSVSPPLN